MLRLAVAVVAIAGIAGVASPSGARASQPLRTAIMDPTTFEGPQAELAFARTKAAGASAVRLVLRWSRVAPVEPDGDARDPADPAYDWSSFDAQVEAAVGAGLDPIVCITHAPLWARDVAAGGAGTTWPKTGALADFAAAAALRYATLAVRTWQVWNEPNARSHLNPQYRGGRPATPGHYRAMVNAFAEAVHAVNPNNVVVAGALAPFGHLARDIQVVAPLRFMRAMLCVSRAGAATCSARAQFDVWAQNPYTNGGPDRQASARDDVSIGDLPEVRRVLAQANRVRHVTARDPVELWVTEFSWDTQPPDPHGVAASLHARWIAEALYAMWQSGVTLVTWWRLRDDPLTTPYQSGLYARRGTNLDLDHAKPSLAAFRFPFVARPTRHGVLVWGRLPPGSAGRVEIERRVGRTWRPVVRIAPDRYGIFRAVLPTPASGSVRARLPGVVSSLPFSLARPPAKRVHPFGCGGSISCRP